MAERVRLTAGRWARFTYLLGYRRTKVMIAGMTVLCLVGAVVWQYPALEQRFLQATGLQTPEQTAKAEAISAEKAKLENIILDARAAIDAAGEIADTSSLEHQIESAEKGLSSSDVSVDSLKRSGRTLSDAIRDLEAEVSAIRQAEQDAQAAAEAEAARLAAEAAARAEAERQANTPAPNPAPQPQPQPAPAPEPQPAPEPAPSGQLASSSLTVTCTRPENVQFVASGGGTVTISAAGQSASGGGSAALAVTVSGTVTATASATGSISLQVSNALTWCRW